MSDPLHVTERPSCVQRRHDRADDDPIEQVRPACDSELFERIMPADDAGLIKLSVSRPECFAALFDRHADAIYRYVARRLGSDAADDLVSETFLIAFQHRGRYDSEHADARPWLYGIATNLVGRRRRDEVRFFRAIARTGVSSAAVPLADRVTERVAARRYGATSWRRWPPSPQRTGTRCC